MGHRCPARRRPYCGTGTTGQTRRGRARGDGKPGAVSSAEARHTGAGGRSWGGSANGLRGRLSTPPPATGTPVCRRRDGFLLRLRPGGQIRAVCDRRDYALIPLVARFRAFQRPEQGGGKVHAEAYRSHHDRDDHLGCVLFRPGDDRPRRGRGDGLAAHRDAGLARAHGRESLGIRGFPGRSTPWERDGVAEGN